MTNQMWQQQDIEFCIGKFGEEAVSYVTGQAGDGAMLVAQSEFLEVLSYLKDEAAWQFDMLSNITAVDFPEHYELVYHLYSREQQKMAVVKTRCTKENPRVWSVTPLWPSADFQEREAYDLMGIHFVGHLQLKRILLPDSFPGHPLRKDFQMNAASR